MADQSNFGTQNPGFMAPLTRANSPIVLPLHDPNDQNNGGTGNDGNQPGAGGGQQQQQQTPSGGGQQPVAGAGGGQQQAARKFEYTEDRSDWIPRHRLNETTTKLTKREQEFTALQGELDAERKRVAALAGVTPQDPKAKETDEIRSAMYQMFPQLKALENLSGEQLQQVFQAAEAAQQTSKAAWERHSIQMLDQLDTEALSIMKTDKLTDRQRNSVRRAYREEATLAMHDRQKQLRNGERDTVETLPTDNDFVARHERGDKTLIKEFAREFLNDWVEPARRSVIADQARRGQRPVPRGERSRLPITQGQQQVNLNNEDEFKKALLAARGGDRE